MLKLVKNDQLNFTFEQKRLSLSVIELTVPRSAAGSPIALSISVARPFTVAGDGAVTTRIGTMRFSIDSWIGKPLAYIQLEWFCQRLPLLR